VLEIPPALGSARLQQTPAGLRITIPVYQSWYHFLATPFTAGIAIVLVSQLGEIPSWLMGGLVALCAVPWARWFWRSLGRQIITVNKVTLRVRYDLLGFGWQDDYSVKQIFELRYMRIVTQSDLSQGLENRPSYGSLCFDYGSQTQKLVGRFTEDDARRLLEIVEVYSAAPLTGLNIKLDRPLPSGLSPTRCTAALGD
jgi:hypothetical protein